MSIPYDEARAFFLAALQGAGIDVDESTPLYDLQRLYYTRTLGLNSNPVTVYSGGQAVAGYAADQLQDAVDYAAILAGLTPQAGLLASLDVVIGESGVLDGDIVRLWSIDPDTGEYLERRLQWRGIDDYGNYTPPDPGCIADGMWPTDMLAMPDFAASSLQIILDAVGLAQTTDGGTVTLSPVTPRHWGASVLVGSDRITVGNAVYGNEPHIYAISDYHQMPCDCSIVLASGTYDVDLVVSVPVRIIGNGGAGEVSIKSLTNYVGAGLVLDNVYVQTPALHDSGYGVTGTVVAPEGLTETGYVNKPLKRESPLGIPFDITGKPMSAGAWYRDVYKPCLADAPLPGPFFTAVPNLVSIVVDNAYLDTTNGNWKVAYAVLGGLTPLEYAASKMIGITWGMVTNEQTSTYSETGLAVPMQDLVAQVQASGGAFVSHSKSHHLTTDASDPTWEHSYNEIVRAQQELELATGYPIYGAIQAGGMNPQPRADRISGMLTRAVYPTYRNGAVMSTAVMPAARYTPAHFTMMGAPDGTGVAGTVGITRFVRQIAASTGLAVSISTHGFAPAGTEPNTSTMSAAQWKALIDELAAAEDAGTIAVVPFPQLAMTYPMGNVSPNLFINPEFAEYTAAPGEGDDGFSYQAWTACSMFMRPLVRTGTVAVSAGTGPDGSNCAVLTNAGKISYIHLSVMDGIQYRLRFQHKNTSGSGLTVYIYLGVRGGDVSPNSYVSLSIPTSGSWALHRYNLTIPRGGYDRIRLDFVNPAASVNSIAKLWMGV